jgi:hypothetical protein
MDAGPENARMRGDTAMSAAKVTAKDVLASLKSGVLYTGTVRSVATEGSEHIAWIAIELPVVGERQVLVTDEQNLRCGQQVCVACVPNPLKPGSYMFELVEVLTLDLTPKLSAPANSLVARLQSRCHWREQFKVRRRMAGK